MQRVLLPLLVHLPTTTFFSVVFPRCDVPDSDSSVCLPACLPELTWPFILPCQPDRQRLTLPASHCLPHSVCVCVWAFSQRCLTACLATATAPNRLLGGGTSSSSSLLPITLPPFPFSPSPSTGHRVLVKDRQTQTYVPQ